MGSLYKQETVVLC